MYYSKLFTAGVNNCGFTNQIFSLITSIIIAYKNNKKVVIIDTFLNDFSKKTHTPISQIFDINKINDFLKKTYNIIIIDKYDVEIKINSVKYGTLEKYIDLTGYILQKFYKNKILHVNKNIIFNNIHGDPCLGKKKNLYLNYTINNYFYRYFKCKI